MKLAAFLLFAAAALCGRAASATESEHLFLRRRANSIFEKIDHNGNDHCTRDHPCGLCEGDCDSDDACKGDYLCFQRGPGKSVPGCSGGSSDHSAGDYCYDPKIEPDHSDDKPDDSSDHSEIDYKGRNHCTKEHPCDKCEGDCDSDNQCKGRYKCFQRSSGKSVPGCRGGSSDHSEGDYCYDPDTSDEDPPPMSPDEKHKLDYKGRDYCDKHTCDVCQGDCDHDGQCKGHLKCTQRHPYESVPGCSGGSSDSSASDYCYDPDYD